MIEVNPAPQSSLSSYLPALRSLVTAVWQRQSRQILQARPSRSMELHRPQSQVAVGVHLHSLLNPFVVNMVSRAYATTLEMQHIFEISMSSRQTHRIRKQKSEDSNDFACIPARSSCASRSGLSSSTLLTVVRILSATFCVHKTQMSLAVRRCKLSLRFSVLLAENVLHHHYQNISITTRITPLGGGNIVPNPYHHQNMQEWFLRLYPMISETRFISF